MARKTRLESETRGEFWEAEVMSTGTWIAVSSGALGSSGKSKVHKYKSRKLAQAALAEMVAARRAEGFTEPGAAPPPDDGMLSVAEAAERLEALGSDDARKVASWLHEHEDARVRLHEGDLVVEGHLAVGPAPLVVTGDLRVAGVLSDCEGIDDGGLLAVLGAVDAGHLCTRGVAILCGDVRVAGLVYACSSNDYWLEVGGDLSARAMVEHGHACAVAGHIHCPRVVSAMNKIVSADGEAPRGALTDVLSDEAAQTHYVAMAELLRSGRSPLRELSDIRAVFADFHELVDRVGKPVPAAERQLQLESDYADVLAHVGELDFSKIRVHIEIGGFEFPRIEAPSPPEVPALAALCYRIATSYGGDELFQITAGRHKGQLVVFDHEVVDWDEIAEDPLVRKLESAQPEEIGAIADAWIAEIHDGDDACTLCEASLAEVLRATFESYTPAPEYESIEATADALYRPFVRTLVNSLGTRADVPFMVTSAEESQAIIEAYEREIQPGLDLFRLTPSMHEQLGSYWLRAVCLLIDAYLACGHAEKLRPYLDDFHALLAAGERIRGTHLLSLRVGAVLCQLGKVSEAVEVLSSAQFGGFGREAAPFRATVAEHALFAAIAAPLELEGPTAGTAVWLYHGSDTLEDLRGFPEFLSQNVSMIGCDRSAWHAADTGPVSLVFQMRLCDLRALKAERGLAWHGDDTDEDVHARMSQMCGVTVDGQHIYVVGGGGFNLAYVSRNGGAIFEELVVPRIIHGLRKALVDGDRLYICGQFGKLVVSSDGGSTFEAVDADFGEQGLNTVMRAAGALWACGDGGAFRSADGSTWSKVDVAGEITRPQPTSFGAVLPSDQGYLYLVQGSQISKTSLRASGAIWGACETSNGSLLAVGADGALFRSSDRGESFAKIETGCTGSLESVACTRDGLVVAVGQHGAVLRSTDDGQRFERLEHPFTLDWLFAAEAHGDRVLVAGSKGILLAVR